MHHATEDAQADIRPMWDQEHGVTTARLRRGARGTREAPEALCVGALRGVLQRVREFVLLGVVVLGSNDVYLQHFQTAKFIQEELPTANVVANDIGLVSMRAGGNVTDIVRLGNTDVLRAVRESGEYGQLSHEVIDPILDRNGADVIAIYPEGSLHASTEAGSPSRPGRWRACP
jgi:hypothetical protein